MRLWAMGLRKILWKLLRKILWKLLKKMLREYLSEDRVLGSVVNRVEIEVEGEEREVEASCCFESGRVKWSRVESRAVE